MLKCRYFIVVRKQLGIKVINKSCQSSHIVKSLVDAFSTIGNKIRSKDRNAARRVLSQAIVKKNTRNLYLLKPTSKPVKCNVKTLCKYCIKREHRDTIV